MKVVNQLCKRDKPYKAITELYPDPYSNDSVYEILHRIAPDFNETFFDCKLFDQWVNCNDILYPFITDEGCCYVFNTFSIYELLTDE